MELKELKKLKGVEGVEKLKGVEEGEVVYIRQKFTGPRLAIRRATRCLANPIQLLQLFSTPSTSY
jgi:hypothetical protein